MTNSSIPSQQNIFKYFLLDRTIQTMGFCTLSCRVTPLEKTVLVLQLSKHPKTRWGSQMIFMSAFQLLEDCLQFMLLHRPCFVLLEFKEEICIFLDHQSKHCHVLCFRFPSHIFRGRKVSWVCSSADYIQLRTSLSQNLLYAQLGCLKVPHIQSELENMLSSNSIIASTSPLQSLIRLRLHTSREVFDARKCLK